MWSTLQIDYVKDLVFKNIISLKAGKILQFMIVNSISSEFYGRSNQVCEFSNRELAKDFKMELPAFRYHLRQLEKEGLLAAVYLFKVNGAWLHVKGYKAAQKIGIRNNVGMYYLLNIPGGDK